MSDDAVRFTARLKGAADVARLLRRHPEKVGRSLDSLIKQEGRGLSVELARNTKPFGFSEKAKLRGEKSVSKDISALFALPSDAFKEIRKSDPAAANRFWANIKKRRFSRAENNLRQTGSAWKDLTVGRLDSTHHVWGARRAAKPKQIVTSAKARETYIAKIQKRVGFAKGSWLNAGKAIGGRIRGAVQWATRHKQAPGSATLRTGDKASVTLVNKLDYIEDVSTREGIQLALQVAAGRLRMALATSLRKINDSANRSLRRRSG